MKAKIIQIGNSKGITIPKGLLVQLGLKDEVDIEAENDCLIIRTVRSARKGWSQKFSLMAKNGDDRLLDESSETDWDKDEWKR